MRFPSILILLIACPHTLKAEDTVYLKNGQFQSGNLVSQTDDALTFRFKKRGESTPQKVTIPWSLIDRIEHPETNINIAAIDLTVLAQLWENHEPWIHRRNSKAGAFGLAYANKLATSNLSLAPEQAIDLYSLIAEKSWDPKLQADAITNKLKTLFTIGREREAFREAERLAIESENPIHLLEAKHLIASRAFDSLKTIEKEHPRWQLDDEIRPLRNAEYHQAIDHALYPFLFYGTFENQAARGLLLASTTYQYNKDFINARICAEDILRLYPKSQVVAEAREDLAKLATLITEE